MNHTESQPVIKQRHAATDAVGEWVESCGLPTPAVARYSHMLDAAALQSLRAQEVVPVKNWYANQAWMALGARMGDTRQREQIPADDLGVAAADPCVNAPTGADATQVDGNHYKGMGDHQPWNVLQTWLTPEEYRGWQKGNAIVYLARERQKGGDKDIAKARHHLEKLLETLA